MPAGAAVPRLEVLGGSQSATLGGSRPAPTSNAWRAISGGAAGGWTRVQPATVHPSRAGARAPGHDLQWFERIHVIPRRVDLSFVLSEQVLAVEVWNAWREASRQLTAITLAGPAGIVVENPDALPVVYPATRARAYTVRALASGDPAIDNTVTWTFAGVATAGTQLVLLGSRLVPWPFPANAGDVDELVEYLTDVHRARNGTEQRIQLRERPRRGLEFEVILEAREAQHANALLQDWQPRVFGVPYWHLANRLAGAVAVNDLVVTLDTTSIPWSDFSTVFLWRDPYTWEALTVASVTPTQIQLATPARKPWAAGVTLAMPLAVGRLPAAQGFGWEDLRLGRARVAFDLEAA